MESRMVPALTGIRRLNMLILGTTQRECIQDKICGMVGPFVHAHAPAVGGGGAGRSVPCIHCMCASSRDLHLSMHAPTNHQDRDCRMAAPCVCVPQPADHGRGGPSSEARISKGEAIMHLSSYFKPYPGLPGACVPAAPTRFTAFI